MRDETSLHVRMTAEMKAVISDLAKEYYLSESELTRRVFLFVNAERPDLPARPVEKAGSARVER